MAMRRVRSQAISMNYNHIARVVSSCTEPIGITDRKDLESITNEVIQKLGGILPGMELFISPGFNELPPDSQIRGVVMTIIEKGYGTVEQPVPVERPEDAPGIEIAENAKVVLEKRY